MTDTAEDDMADVKNVLNGPFSIVAAAICFDGASALAAFERTLFSYRQLPAPALVN